MLSIICFILSVKFQEKSKNVLSMELFKTFDLVDVCGRITSNKICFFFFSDECDPEIKNNPNLNFFENDIKKILKAKRHTKF